MVDAIYRLLNNTIREIRVLKILDRKTDWFHEPLACTFEYVSLAENPSFAALSYTWGNTIYDERYPVGEVILKNKSEASSVTINGVSIKVGKNLLSALQYLRVEATFGTISGSKPRFTPQLVFGQMLCALTKRI